MAEANTCPSCGAQLAPDALHLSSQTIAAQVEGLYGGSLHDVSIDLREGEVVGITGLLGSGFEDLPYLIFGARPATAGQLTLLGRRHDLRTMTPAQAIAQGIVLVPADRQNDGSIGSLSVADNITMQVIDRYVRAMRLDRTRIRRDAQQLLQQFDVRPPEPRLAYQGLSGGNQQKVLLAKWPQVYAVYDSLDRDCSGAPVTLGRWANLTSLRVCRVSTRALVLTPQGTIWNR